MARRASQAVVNESMTFWCRVLILRVISDQPWYYFSWAVCHCKKGVSKFGNVYMCSSCEDVCTLPTARYKLQLEITNGVSNVVVTLFDEVAERLIKKPAQDLLAGNIPLAFVYKVLIKKIRTETPWCYLACDVCKNNEGISDVEGAYWCGVCASICKAPTIRYRLEMEVNNGKTFIVAIFHNTEAGFLIQKPAIDLLPDFKEQSDFYQVPPEITNVVSNTHHILEFKTNTYIDHGGYESFVCNRVISSTGTLKLPVEDSDQSPFSCLGLEEKPFPPVYRNGQDLSLELVVRRRSSLNHQWKTSISC